jgi:hypothetical protein
MNRIDVLPDDVLLEIFDLHDMIRGMAIAGPCVSTMEKPCFSITASPESATFLYTKHTRKGYTGRLASLSSHRYGRYQCGLFIRHGQRHCSTWAEQSRMSCRPLESWGSAIEKRLGRDAGAIPGVDRSAAPLKF